MYECRYCGNVFENLTRVGACPACGGPQPKRLKKDVEEVIVEKYVYIQATPRVSAYYTPPEPTFIQRIYGTFGYKVVFGGIMLAATSLVIWFLYFWFFYRTGTPKDSDPKYQNIIPTAVASVTPYIDDDPWRDTIWITSDEALTLRENTQVVNLAWLGRGEARYTNKSIVFSSDVWQKTKPLGLTELKIDGTGFQTNINGYRYYLNIFQPFVINGQPKVVYLVDSRGQIWKIDSDDIKLVDLESAQNSLSIQISPNPRLSPTH